MCGIVGVMNLAEHPPVEAKALKQMLGMIRHRGPDETGFYRDARVGLGSARLSIIDLSGGQQPIANEDETLWLVFNGEVFNYVELRTRLEARGHRFATHADTEVILHLYEDEGAACLNHLNGQFAIALWDAKAGSLLLARDRLGIRPLFYTVVDSRLVFGSEVKALLAHPAVRAELDPAALAQVFTYWSPLTPRTVFRNIVEVPPGHYLLARAGQVSVQPFWALDFSEEGDARRPWQAYLEELEALLVDAVRIRLRADVPVGAYLSGGLDSSITAALIRQYTHSPLDTFSIAFEDPQFDESRFQQHMAATLGTHHHVITCSYEDIGRVFPEVIWHTETPVLRTSPAPMFLLAQRVHEQGFKVVVTGEGADEFLAGYDIFKEMKVRRFWAKNPTSRIRPLLLKRLYPYIGDLGGTSAYLAAFFRKGLGDTDSPFYSHLIRWRDTGRMRRLLRAEHPAAQGLLDADGWDDEIALPPGFATWSHLAQAQYLEITTFLSSYLLSSQGDRVAMAHAVEGRFPFLDPRVVEFCNRLPSWMKLRGLTEKWLLKQLGRRLVPDAIWQRFKQPYRAPIQRSFIHERTPDYVHDMLSQVALRDSGLFHVPAVAQLVSKARAGKMLSEVDQMALVGILSTQLVYDRFVKAFRVLPVQADPRAKVVDRLHPLQHGAL